jgi:6-phosphogluconolactonase (cycloisomerase 2 family)
MRTFARIALSAALLVLAGGAAAFAPAVAAAKPGSGGYLYVNDNTAGGNTVAGFARHADGTLTPLRGSPFPIGGAGTGVGTGSQGALQQSADGRYLLAADAGSNEISVLRIKPDGGLTEAEGSPVWSGGNEPVSIAIHDNLVYVANAGDGAVNYTGFKLNAGGHLRPLADSTFSLPDGSSPGDVLFNGDGTRLVGTRVNTSLIDSFVVGSSGRLTTAPGSPYAAQGQGPFGSEFSPTNAAHLYVSNAHDGAGDGTVSAFGVAANGALTSIGSSPFADHQTAPCWVEISHDGSYLFAVNTASGTISRFQIAADGTLTLLGSTPFSGKGSFDARLAPDGGTLWVVNDGSNTVSGLTVSGGNLSEIASSPTALPAGATPFGIVVT